MNRSRTLINLASFIVLSTLLVYIGVENYIVQQERGPRLTADFVDATGLRPRNDVTMRGVVVGSVTHVELIPTGTKVGVLLDPGTEVPKGTTAMIVRRSPIGELTIELEPGEGEPLPDGAHIAMSDTRPPPDVSETLEAFANILHAVPSEDLNTVVSELATAVDGRARDLARFAEASRALPERLLEIESELESLIRTGPELTGVFADNADVFADDITQLARLADLLRDKRFELVDLSREGAGFLKVAGGLIKDEKANLSCFIRDAGKANATVAAAQKDLIATLQTNHFFFDAVRQAVLKDPDGGTWFRVQVLPHQEPSARQYENKRPVPDVFPGRACNSRYGRGVGPAKGKAVLPDRSKVRR